MEGGQLPLPGTGPRTQGATWFDQAWGSQLVPEVQADPLARRCAGALMRWQSREPVPTYWSEDTDCMGWLAYEALQLTYIVLQYDSADEVLSLLASTGWWDPDTEGPERAEAVAAELGVL